MSYFTSSESEHEQLNDPYQYAEHEQANDPNQYDDFPKIVKDQGDITNWRSQITFSRGDDQTEEIYTALEEYGVVVIKDAVPQQCLTDINGWVRWAFTDQSEPGLQISGKYSQKTYNYRHHHDREACYRELKAMVYSLLKQEEYEFGT